MFFRRSDAALPFHYISFRKLAKSASNYSENLCFSFPDNPLNGNAIDISEDFAKKTQRRRQELVPYRKFLKKKLGDDRKVYIAYPAILKYVDANGRHRIVGTEELAKLRQEMEEAKS